MERRWGLQTEKWPNLTNVKASDTERSWLIFLALRETLRLEPRGKEGPVTAANLSSRFLVWESVPPLDCKLCEDREHAIVLFASVFHHVELCGSTHQMLGNIQ